MARPAGPLELIGPPNAAGGGEFSLRFQISDWAAIAPGLDSHEAWMDWARSGQTLPQDDAMPVKADAIPSALRRRLDRMGRMALQALFAVEAGPQDLMVFASRFGELARSIDLMRQIGGGELPSPTGFALSVHNALAGQASIALKNQVAHSAVAAGIDTLPMGLLEAALAAGQSPGRDAILVCYDVAPPSIFATRPTENLQMAVALRIRPATNHGVVRRAAAKADPTPYQALLRLVANDDLPSVAWQGRHGIWRLGRAA